MSCDKGFLDWKLADGLDVTESWKLGIAGQLQPTTAVKHFTYPDCFGGVPEPKTRLFKGVMGGKCLG